MGGKRPTGLFSLYLHGIVRLTSSFKKPRMQNLGLECPWWGICWPLETLGQQLSGTPAWRSPVPAGSHMAFLFRGFTSLSGGA